MPEDRPKHNNFNLLETLALVIFVAVLGAVYAYVVHARNSSNSLFSNSSLKNAAPPGTTASIDQLTMQDGAKEAAIEDSHDDAYAQAATSPNSAVMKVGTSYDESKY